MKKQRRAKRFPKRRSGAWSVGRHTAPLKSSFYPQTTPARLGSIRNLQSISDSLRLQFVLAYRASVLLARLSAENGSPRRLPRKIRPAPRDIRPRPARATVTQSREKIDMAARGQCWRSHDCSQTDPTVANARTGRALRVDRDDHNRIRIGKQKRSASD